jgi:hypothetical protein
MSRAKGNEAPRWVAAWLQPWWPGCEAIPNSRKGRDILGTPGTAIEVKTGVTWRTDWKRQADGYAQAGECAMLVYLPPGCGAASVGDGFAIFRVRQAMDLLVAAEYAPPATARRM